MRFVHECIPCGTAWTVPVRKCPYCGKDSTPFRIEVLSPSDVASAVVTNLRDDVIEECIAECNSAATDKAAYTGAERAGFHMAAFRLRALKNAAPQPSTAALAPGLSHESLGQGDVAVAASNTRSAIPLTCSRCGDEWRGQACVSDCPLHELVTTARRDKAAS